MKSTFKEFELKVLYIVRKLDISMFDIMQWRYADLIKAYELLN